VVQVAEDRGEVTDPVAVRVGEGAPVSILGLARWTQ
jgi:hypothetical protein